MFLAFVVAMIVLGQTVEKPPLSIVEAENRWKSMSGPVASLGRSVKVWTASPTQLKQWAMDMDRQVRSLAIDEAARRGPVTLLTISEIVLGNDWTTESKHGLEVILALKRWNTPGTTQLMAKLFQHPDRMVRWWAATERLAKQDARGLKLVGEALREGDPNLKMEAAQIAASGGYKTLVPDLQIAQRRLESMPTGGHTHASQAHVREVIRIARGWLGDPIMLKEFRRYKTPTRDELRVIAAVEGRKARPLLEACLNRSLWHRIVALGYLTRLADRRSIAALRLAARTQVPDDANSRIGTSLHTWALNLADDLEAGRRPVVPRLQVEDPFLPRALHRVPR
ncbi:MAG: hypothetical protein HONBIEJF_00563 [Fimbriimonadaceae bacterium]|nr:hypothetical protein [Fimbriimonadaceae bacterium]